MRHLVLMALLLLAAPGAALPSVGGLTEGAGLLDFLQDDAGSGGDAADRCEAAGDAAFEPGLQVGGFLVPLDDPRDYLVLRGLQPGMAYTVVMDPSPSLPLNSNVLPPDYDLVVLERDCGPLAASCEDRGGNHADRCTFDAPAAEVVVGVLGAVLLPAFPDAAPPGPQAEGPGCVPYCALDWVLSAA